MNTLQQKYAERITVTLDKYPDKRSAVMPMLYIAQEEYGHITPEGIAQVAEICDMDPTQVKSIAGFYTMYSEKAKGKYWLQVCVDLPCALRGADEFHHWLLDELGIEEGGTTAHVAIVARSLGLVAVGQAENIVSVCENGDDIIVDGPTGTVHLRPTRELEQTYVDKVRISATPAGHTSAMVVLVPVTVTEDVRGDRRIRHTAAVLSDSVRM